MGKIRVKTFDESADPEMDAKKKAKKEAKIAAKKEAVKNSPIKIEDATETVESSEEEIITSNEEVNASDESKTASAKDSETDEKVKKTKKEKFVKTKSLSERIAANKKMVSKTEKYPLEKAVTLLTQFKTSKFDETVELHVNVAEKGHSGVLTLPHGSGKTLRIKIADDATIADITNGKIEFDILVAEPAMMPKLAKVARVLGPRGLMPNPKNGTVSAKPEEAVKKLSGGELRFKTESKAPVIHLIIGKISFGDKKILENADAAIKAVGAGKIKSAILTSTMSPGIKLQIVN